MFDLCGPRWLYRDANGLVWGIQRYAFLVWGSHGCRELRRYTVTLMPDLRGSRQLHQSAEDLT